MVGSLIAWSVRARLLVLPVAAVLIALGALQLRGSETDLLPEFSPTYVEVQTEALGLSAEEVEQLITAPMENLLLNGVAYLDDIRSESVNGLSSITLVFEQGTDLLTARQVVQERLTQAGLLAHLTDPPVMLQPTSSASRVMAVGFRSEEVSPIEMSVLARWSIRPKLLGVPGVANVAIFGQRERQLQVQVDAPAMAQHDVTLQEVISTSGNALWVSPLSYLNASSPGTGGFVDTFGTRLEIRHVSPISTADELGRVALERGDGTSSSLVLSDVATVVEDHQPLIGDAVVDDGPGLVMVIEKLPGANTVEVTEGVEEALATLAPGLRGVEVDTALFRPASFVQQARTNLLVTLGIGLALASLLLGLLLLQWRATVVALASGAAALMVAVLVLDRWGTGLNAMVTAGLVLAIVVIVHDVVVDVHDVVVDADASGPERSVLPTRRSMGYATAIVLVAATPLLVTGRLAGEFTRPAAIGFMVAVLASFVVALTLTPALASLLLPGRSARPRDEVPAIPPTRSSAPVGGRARRTPSPAPRAVGTLAVLAVLAVAGLVAVPTLEQSDQPALLPTFQESDLVVRWRGVPGVSRTAMTEVAADLGGRLRALPGVRDVGGHVGRAVLSDRVNGIGVGELWVALDPEGDRDSTVAAVRQVTADYGRADAEVRSYFADRVEEVGGLLSEFDRGRIGAARDEVVIRIYGEDLAVLRQQADVVAADLDELDPVSEVRVETPATEPNVEVEVDLAAAEQHGLKPGDVRRAASTLVSGLRVGSLFEAQKVFDVVVVGDRPSLQSPARIGALLLDTPDGGSVRLDEVASVSVGSSLSVINRESVSRRIDLVATVDGDRASAVDRIEERIAAIGFPLEYHAEVIGDVAQRATDDRRLAVVGLGALVAVLLLLQVGLGSWRRAAATMLLLPFALSGGLIATAVFGGTVTVGTALGFLAVLALFVRNALVQGRQQEDHRPAVVSGVVGAMVLLPVLVAGTRPGLEVLHPMSLVVVGGIVTTTLVSWLVLPLLADLGNVDPDPTADLIRPDRPALQEV